jgi:hypothetical protein
MKKDPRIEATKDFFSYFTAYYPEFPAEDQMDGSQALEILVSGVEYAQGVSRNEVSLHWGMLCKIELAKAVEGIARGDTSCVDDAVKSARELFEHMLAGKAPKPDFIAYEDGTLEKS